MSISHQASLSVLLGLCVAGCAASKPKPQASADDGPLSSQRTFTPGLTPEQDPNQRVVVDSVNDTVDRFDKIIKQREADRQASVDAKGAREAAAAKPDDNDPSIIEKLAAAVRAHKPIDPPPDVVATATPPASHAADPAALVKADDNVSGALGTPTGVHLESPADAPTIGRGSSVDPMLAVEEKFNRRVAEDPRDLSAQMDLQLMRFLKQEPVPNMTDLSALPAEDRELLAAMCDALGNFRSVVSSSPNPLASEKARPFIDMADRIRVRSDLTLNGLTLCEKVAGFGNYEKIDPLVFNAGTPRKVVLYCEVDGFLSQLSGDQKWETKLSLGLKLYDEHGLQVWEVPADSVTDSVSRRRRDFFLNKRITLPPNLSGGHYMLKATVQDVQANRIAQQTIQFTVNSPGQQGPVPR